MRTALSMALGLTLVFALALTASAEEKKADKGKTYEGTLTCAKCDLKLETKCMTVLKVKDGDKDVVYYLDDKAGKANHKAICTEAKKAKVTGTVKKDGDKQILTASKVEIEK